MMSEFVDNKILMIEDMSTEERPRERLELCSASALKNSELLAILLRSGCKNISVVALAEQLLYKYKTLGGLANASLEELRQNQGIGRVKAIELKAFLELALRLHKELASKVVTKILSAKDVVSFFASEFVYKEQEEFWLLSLNTKNHVLEREMLFRGLADRCPVGICTMMHYAVKAHAKNIIIVHNHPSGDCTPSKADIEITKRIKQAAGILEISLLDHIIIGGKSTAVEEMENYYSFQEHNLI